MNAFNPNALSTQVIGVNAQQVARSTVNRYKPKFESAAKLNRVSLGNVTREMVIAGGKNKATSSVPPLLSVSDRKFLEDIAITIECLEPK